MSERERWVVYPLLFLALGAALRDKLIDRTMTKSIVCQELTVVDEDSVRILAQIGRIQSMRGATANGYLVVNGQIETNLINSQQYAYRNVPFVPALQAIFASPLNLLRSLPQALPTRKPTDNAAPTSPQSPATSAPPAADSHSDEVAPPSTLPRTDSDASPAKAPLADPEENR